MRAIVERYMDAWERGDVDAVVASDITGLVDPSAFARFGMPDSLRA